MSTWRLKCNKWARKKANLQFGDDYCILIKTQQANSFSYFSFFMKGLSAAGRNAHDPKLYSGFHGVTKMLHVQRSGLEPLEDGCN